MLLHVALASNVRVKSIWTHSAGGGGHLPPNIWHISETYSNRGRADYAHQLPLASLMIIT